MIATIFVGILVFGYAAFVVGKKVKDAKDGKFCNCGCGGCTKNCGAKIPEE